MHEKKSTEKDKKHLYLCTLLEKVTEEDISYGEEPRYFFAQLFCNSTGVGESRFHDTETRRTVSKDYSTDVLPFIDGHIGAGAKGLSLFYAKPNQTVHYYAKEEMKKVATRQGYFLHAQDFRDLNFTLSDHRLNRYTANVTKGPFSYPIRPIFATVMLKKDECRKVTIGYLYEKEEKKFVIIEPEVADLSPSGEKSGCAPWMILGIFCPVLFLIPAFMAYIKSTRERMIG